MTNKLLVLGTLAAVGAFAQGYVTRAWFPDGAEVQLQTETTGGTRQTVPAGAGMTRGEHVLRIVQDSRHRIVFCYELEAARVAGSQAVRIRIKPAEGETPTVSAVREFPAVKLGEEVKIEILTKPETGEKVYDVIRPADEPNPTPGRGMVRVSAFSATSGVKLTVNGKAQWLENAWTPGKPARLYIPGQGAYYLSWQERPDFRLAGYQQGTRLVFLFDSAYVEMTFDQSVALASAGGPLWIYHDAKYTGSDMARLDVPNLEALHAK